MIKRTGQILGMLVGTSLSPSPTLLKIALDGYFDLEKASQGAHHLLAEVEHYTSILATSPETVCLDLLPKLIVVLITGSAFVISCSYLGGLVLPSVIQKFRIKTASL